MRESVWHSLKRGGLHVALVAMMLRALLPAGWMPTMEASAPLVICTTAGTLDHDTAPKHDPAKAQDHGICPFASLTTATPPNALIALSAPSLIGRADAITAGATASVSKPRFFLSPSRAPPALV